MLSGNADAVRHEETTIIRNSLRSGRAVRCGNNKLTILVSWFFVMAYLLKKCAVDPLNAGQLVSFLIGLKSCKKDFNKPHCMGYNPQRFVRQGLAPTFRATYAAFSKRAFNQKNAGYAQGDKNANPLVALHSAPGGGKSFFLDQLAQLQERDIRDHCTAEHTGHDEMDCAFIADILRRSVAICVTYNNSCNYTSNTDGLPDKGLAMRMLWAYFMDQLDHPWAEFVSHCMHSLERLPSPDEALHAIKHHCDCPILLCVDELIRASPIETRCFLHRKEWRVKLAICSADTHHPISTPS